MKRFLITFLLLLLIAAGAFAGFCYWAGNRPEPFAVLYDGEEINGEVSGICLSVKEPLCLKITGDHTYQIIPRETDFRFTENGTSRALTEIDDFTSGFCFTETDDGHLIMTPVGGLSGVISAVTGRDAVVGEYDTDLDLFTLVIRSGDGEKTCKINFGFYRYEVDGVELSEEVIRF